jgi:nicotinate dehydrogenase subunit A
VKLSVNGREHAVDAPRAARLLDVLRDDLGLKGTREGCGSGDCGSCRVLLDGAPMAACQATLGGCEGAAVTTVEGLAPTLAQAFFDEQAAQCGFCSSGMLVAAAALLRRNAAPSEDDVKRALDGQLCRCGAHPRIVRAVLRAARA